MFTTVLPKNAQAALAILGKSNILPDKTYLAGGTALALQFGHRISIDFDFFTPSEFIGKEVIKKLEKVGKFVFQESAEKNTLLGLFQGVRFSLFKYDYPLVMPTINYLGIKLASKEDIFAMKIAAIMDRGTIKDFVDVYFLIKKGISLDQSLDYYNKKYKALANNIYSIVRSLTYFDDTNLKEMPEMIEKIDWEEIKKFFEKETVRIAEKYLEP
ncbi:nucleotidyl transferase AbiEii/AbiGii toxin family protein [Candidatus Roizmanbacteria bacterium]|nr:nucleotidyl transferase AbiEii/AbiGii toxin family protein [Candidatus Roizmanbacteria bacterium]